MDSKKIVKSIETELVRRGISKGQFYKESGISSATFSQWKTGVYYPSVAALKKVEKYLGMRFETIADVTAEDEIEKPATGKGDGLSKADVQLISWFRSLPQEKQKAILTSLDAPEGLV